MRNLEMVQAHSLFTFMGRLADGPGGILQQRLAERKLARRAQTFSSNGRLDGLWSATAPAHENTCAHVRTEVDDCLFSLPEPAANARPITASLSTAAGHSGGFKVTSQSTGVCAPSAKQKAGVGEVLHTRRVLLTGYCGGHTVSRMAEYK